MLLNAAQPYRMTQHNNKPGAVSTDITAYLASNPAACSRCTTASKSLRSPLTMHSSSVCSSSVTSLGSEAANAGSIARSDSVERIMPIFADVTVLKSTSK